MKDFVTWFLTLALGIFVVVGGCYYVIPKYIQKSSNKWITFVDNAISFVCSHWKLLLIILFIVIVVIAFLYFYIKSKKKNV